MRPLARVPSTSNPAPCARAVDGLRRLPVCEGGSGRPALAPVLVNFGGDGGWPAAASCFGAMAAVDDDILLRSEAHDLLPSDGTAEMPLRME
eukprot:351965-Chlamydomonas_euryale.AAC.26